MTRMRLIKYRNVTRPGVLGRYKKRWWQRLGRRSRPLLPDDYNDECFEGYFKAYGWAEGRIGVNKRNDMLAFAEDAAEFYAGPEIQKAWDEYRVEFVLMNPFVAFPTFEKTQKYMKKIMDAEDKIFDYVGAREFEELDKRKWKQMDYIAEFILKMINLRHDWEVDPALIEEDGWPVDEVRHNELKTRKKWPAWDNCDKWAAAHLLHSMLFFAQTTHAIWFMESYPSSFAEYARKARDTGGINPLVLDFSGEKEFGAVDDWALEAKQWQLQKEVSGSLMNRLFSAAGQP